MFKNYLGPWNSSHKSLLKFFVNILASNSSSKISRKLDYISGQQKMCVFHCLQIKIHADENQGRAHPSQRKERRANEYLVYLQLSIHVSLAFYMLLIFLNNFEKTSKMICNSNFMVLNHFWTFWRKIFNDFWHQK